MRAIIIAAGDGRRWDNYLGVPKHLAPVKGEAIIHRTQRQLAERGVSDVRVVTRDDRYVTTGASEEPVGFEDARGGVKKFLDSSHLWNPEGRTVVIYGDVYFTDAGMDTLVGHEAREWLLFCRFTQSSFNGGRHAECFAQSFYPEHHAEHLAALHRVRDLAATGGLRRAGGWEHYKAMTGAALVSGGAQVNRGRCVVIDDATDDVDRPVHYHTLLQAVG